MLTDQSRTKLHYIIHYLQPADPHCFNKLRSLRLARAPSSSSSVLRSLYTVLWESMMISHVISRNCHVSARPCPTPPPPPPVLQGLLPPFFHPRMISHVISRNCHVSARPCPTPPPPCFPGPSPSVFPPPH